VAHSAAPRTAALLATLALVGPLGAGWASAAPSPRPPAAYLDRASTGATLFRAYSSVLMTRNPARVKAVLGPSFMIQRGNGSWAGRAAYLADLPILRDYTLTQVHESRGARSVTMVAVATSHLTVDGVDFKTTPAPMMAVFNWNGSRWWMVAQGNFNVPARPSAGREG